MAHKGASLNKAMSHQWLTTEGVFGVALGVSTSFVFLFVLFGALLEKAGAGNYFTKVSFSLLGHMRGGAGKGCCGVFRVIRPYIRFFHRQCCNYGYLYHSIDEARGVSRLQGRGC